jgi:methyl-accepting chemotaxis protein
VKVEEGTKLVNDSGATLGEIVISVKKVNDIISEIASASEEQSTGIKQVNQAVMQIDETVQQNAALVEQAAAAAESLREQSEILNNLMDEFNTGDNRAAATAVKATAPPRRVSPRAARAPASVTKKSTPAPSPVRVKAAGGNDSWQEF